MASNYLGVTLKEGGGFTKEDHKRFLEALVKADLSGRLANNPNPSSSDRSVAGKAALKTELAKFLNEKYLERLETLEENKPRDTITTSEFAAYRILENSLSKMGKGEFSPLEKAEDYIDAAGSFLPKAKQLDDAISEKRSRITRREDEQLDNEEWQEWVANEAESLGLDPDFMERPRGVSQFDINKQVRQLKDSIKTVESESSKFQEEVSELRAIPVTAEKLREDIDLISSGRPTDFVEILTPSERQEAQNILGDIAKDDSAPVQLFERELNTAQQTRRRPPAPGELDVDPETLSPGTDLTASEREREFGVSEPPVVPEMEAAAIEAQQAADLREAEIETEKRLAEDFAAAEFGVGGPARTPRGSGSRRQEPALNLSSRLGDIGSAFNISDQFGYRYFLFEPGTENERQDMLIDDPDNPGTQINVLEYITSKNLTNEAEILEAFKQTEWFNETSETMQNFDLAWDAAGPWDDWDNLTARREELIGAEKDYIEEQLELLGITDQVDEAEVNKLATFVKRNGMDTGEIRDYLSDVESIDFQSYIADADTGLLGTYKGALATTAAQYMVELDNDQLNMFVEGLYDADDPEAQLSLFKNQFKNMAKERFPTLSGVIDQGITPQQYFAPYSARVSKLLDRPVDFMSERDSSIFDQIASGMPDDKFGQRTMTFTEMNEYVRGLDEWQYTKNANDEARQIANNVGRMFGFVA